MPSYRVVWCIDIDAENPEDAARQALNIQRDPESIATWFDVFNDQGDHLTSVDVELFTHPH